MSDDTWLVQRSCAVCGAECYADPTYRGELRCGPCWVDHVGAQHSNAQYRVRPPRVEGLIGRKKPGRYIKGEFVYWDETLNR